MKYSDIVASKISDYTNQMREIRVSEISPVDISRQRDFTNISEKVKSYLLFLSSAALVIEGDALAILREFPDNSVSLILTDPPYHATKKKNIYGDTLFGEDQQYLDWIANFAEEWRRVLRSNGSLLLFCDSSMAARLEVLLSQDFNILSHVVWTKPNDPGFDGWKGKMKKEALRQWYPHSERILFAEPAIEGNLFRSPFGLFLYNMRKQAGLSMHQLTARIGAHGKVNHGGAVSNWEAGRNTPSREQYDRICEALIETGKIEVMPLYEDVIRVFDMDASKQFTDVWDFPSVRPYKGKHPAEKPINLLEHAISATTYKGDIVLDCFSGSGNTAIAALGLKRRTISIEIDKLWADRIATRIEELTASENLDKPPDKVDEFKRRLRKTSAQVSLFPVTK